MSFDSDTPMEKCAVCKKMAATACMVRQGFFTRVCIVCIALKNHEDEKQRRENQGTMGAGTFLALGLLVAGGAAWYFKVDVPYAENIKAFIAKRFGGKSDRDEGSGKAPPEPTKTPSVGDSSPALSISGAGTQTLTLNLRSDVLFEFGSATLKPAAGGTLREATNAIRPRPRASVVIRGHTDSIGTEPANLSLSRQRAESVRDWMVKNGLPAKRLSVVGMGAKEPIAPNTKPDGSDDPVGREKNRRVTIVVTGS